MGLHRLLRRFGLLVGYGVEDFEARLIDHASFFDRHDAGHIAAAMGAINICQLCVRA